jgi:exoribonuclease-2
MIIHWQIKSALAREKDLKAPTALLNETEVAELAKRSEIAARRGRRGGLNATVWWQAELINSRLQGPMVPQGYKATEEMVDLREPIEAVVASATDTASGPEPFRNTVEIPGLGVPATLLAATDKNLEIMDKVMVRVTRVDQASGSNIYCEPA